MRLFLFVVVFMLALVSYASAAGCDDKTAPCTCKVGKGIWQGSADNCKYICKDGDVQLTCAQAEETFKREQKNEKENKDKKN